MICPKYIQMIQRSAAPAGVALYFYGFGGGWMVAGEFSKNTFLKEQIVVQLSKVDILILLAGKGENCEKRNFEKIDG